MVHVFLFSRRSVKLFLLVFIISLAGFVAVFYQANDEFQMYVNQIGIIDKVAFSGKTASDADRSEGMKLAVDNAMEAPLWGMGPGYGKAIRETGYLSTFLGFMGNYGFLGGFLFILFWITFLQKIKKMPDIPNDFSKLAESDLEELAIPESVRRRVLYIIRESISVDDAISALKKNDWVVFSRIVTRSQESLRDRFEISCPELDWLVKRAMEFVAPDMNDIVCSRLTGRGFGGCTYSILRANDIQTYIEKLGDYERIFGFKPLYYKVKPSGGVRIL